MVQNYLPNAQLQSLIEGYTYYDLDLLSYEASQRELLRLPMPGSNSLVFCWDELYKKEENELIKLPAVWLGGIESKNSTYKAQKRLRMFCVNFKPQGNYYLLRFSLQVLQHSFMNFNDFSPQLGKHLLEVGDQLGIKGLIKRLETYFLSQLVDRKSRDFFMVRGALQHLELCPHMNPEQIAQEIGVLPGTLDRAFALEVGIGMEQFYSMSRYLSAVARGMLHTELTVEEMAKCCFYRHAEELEKEFVGFSGTSYHSLLSQLRENNLSEGRTHRIIKKFYRLIDQGTYERSPQFSIWKA